MSAVKLPLYIKRLVGRKVLWNNPDAKRPSKIEGKIYAEVEHRDYAVYVCQDYICGNDCGEENRFGYMYSYVYSINSEDKDFDLKELIYYLGIKILDKPVKKNNFSI